MKKKFQIIFVGASLSLMALGGCQTVDDTVSPALNETELSIHNQIGFQIAEAGNRSANALETLAMIQRTRTEPAPPPLAEAALPPELKTPVTLAWSGPAPVAVKRLAANIGYSFIETGSEPSSPVNIQIDVRETSAAQALQDIGLQVQKFATVIVDPNTHKIEYRNEISNTSFTPPAKKSPTRTPAAANKQERRQ